MTIQESIKSINDQARKVFGADTSILVARAPAFGNDDTCIIVSGKRHAEAARGFAAIKGARLNMEVGQHLIDDTEYTFTTVTPPPLSGGGGMTTNPTPLMQQLNRDFEALFGPLTDEQMEEGDATQERA